MRSTLPISVALSLVCGCETYAPLPLDRHPGLAAELAQLRTNAAVDVSKPLGADAVATLAVLNNPDLVAARADRGIAEAQLLQAGLLPNPQISASYGFLRAGPGTTDQWTAGLAEDIRALVTLTATRRGAELSARQTEADILWQEWQVVGKARLLVVDLVEQGQLNALLREARALLGDRAQRDEAAVDAGNLTLAAVAPDLAALADIDRQTADGEIKQEAQARDLDLLLGVAPGVRVPLDPELTLPPIDADAVRRTIGQLPDRRPDLIALKLGYGAQEEKLRAAILGQFPALILGGSGGHDTSAVYSAGPSVTMDLPLFNRNQGNIAIETATRQKLHAEYTNRLTASASEIEGLLAGQSLLGRQLVIARVNAIDADRAAEAALNAYRSALIDSRDYVDLVTAALTRKQEVVTIEQRIFEQQVALATLTGIGLPVVESLPDFAGGEE